MATTLAERDFLWKLRNPDKRKVAIRRWRASNKEHIREYQRQDYARNRESRRAKAKRLYAIGGNVKSKSYYQQNRERLLAEKKEQRRNNPEKHKMKDASVRRRLRAQVFSAYGGCCACCGEARYEFLTIDHIKGNGKDERKAFGANSLAIYRLLKSLGYPKDSYRVLCMNCNCSLGFYKYCPHKEPHPWPQ